MSSRKLTGLPKPSLPKEAPLEFGFLLDQVLSGINEGDGQGAVAALQECFRFLTSFFASVAVGTAEHLEVAYQLDQIDSLAKPDDFVGTRNTLNQALTCLGDKATDPLSKGVRTVFFVGSTRSQPTPRRHSRLLELAGIPIRGYRLMQEWVELPVGVGDLEGNGRCSRELRRYLPIYKEWVTAAANFFRSFEITNRVIEEDSYQITAILSEQEIRLPGLALTELLRPGVEQWAVSSSVDEPEVSEESEATESEAEAPEPEPGSEQAEEAEQAEETEEVEEASAGEESPGETAEEAPAEAVESEELKPEEATVAAEAEQQDEASEQDEDEELLTGPVPTDEEAFDLLSGGSAEGIELDPALLEAAEPEAVAEMGPEPESVERELEGPDADAPDIEQAETEAAEESEEETDESEEETDESEEPTSESEESGDSEESEPEPQPVAVAAVAGAEEGAGTSEAAAEEKEKKASTPPPSGDTDDPVLAALWGIEAKEEAAPVQFSHGFDTDNPPEYFDEIMVDGDYPEPVATAINDLNGGIEANDAFLICGQLQRCLDVLVQHLAGVCGALVMELEPDEVSDFDLEDERLDLEMKLEMLGVCLSALEVHWEVDDVATLVWSAFYDITLPTGDPQAAYLHTRLLGVEGIPPEPFDELVNFCSQKPGTGSLKTQDDCRLAAHRYLNVLTFWLENSTPLFLECDIDFVSEDKNKALSWAATVTGQTLDGTIPGLWLEVDPTRWNLPRPEMAPVYVTGDAPEILQTAVEELNVYLESEDVEQAGLHLRLSLDFMLNYFAGCAGAAWQDEGRLSPEGQRLFSPDASLDERQRLLVLALGALGSNSKVGKALGKIFARNSLQFRLLSKRTVPKGLADLASWVASREPVTDEGLAQYMPVLRSWVGAGSAWFCAGEQLFEEPNDEGVIEGVVVYDDIYLEMVDPEYCIVLPPELRQLVDKEVPVSEAEAPSSVDVRVLEKLELYRPQGLPSTLEDHLERLASSLTDTAAASAWIGTSFEYLLQYFAGLCASCCLDNLVRDEVQWRKPEASIREREKLLVASLKVLKDSASTELQTELSEVFFDGGQPRGHTRLLGYSGKIEANETLLSYWCRSRHLEGDVDPGELSLFVGHLNDWLRNSEKLFSACEHFEEEAGADGQEEIVVVYGDDFLELVHPDYGIQLPARGYYEVLYREEDDQARREAESYLPAGAIPQPELVSPVEGQTELLGGAAGLDSSELLGGAEFGGIDDDMFSGGSVEAADDELFAAPSYDTPVAAASPAESKTINLNALSTAALKELSAMTSAPEEKAEKPKAATATKAKEKPPEAPKKKKKKSRRSEMGAAVLEAYKKERLEKARRRAAARKRKEEEEPAKLDIALSYLGLKKSPVTNTNIHTGTLVMINSGGGELKGTVKPNHPCVRVNRTTFQGKETRILYFIDPTDMPSSGKAGLVVQTQSETVELRSDQLIQSSWLAEMSAAKAAAFLCAPGLVSTFIWLGAFLGLIRPQMVSGAASNVMVSIFAALILYPGSILVPAFVDRLKAQLGPEQQYELQRFRAVFSLLPSIFLVLAAFLTPLGSLSIPEGWETASLRRACLLFVPLNIISFFYLLALRRGWLEEKIPDEGNRTTLSIGLSALALAAIMAVSFLL